MINAGNIAGYIEYLYRQKYGQPAPAEVLESWAPLPDGEIAQHLATLYQHWGMDAAAARQMEQQFTNTSAPASPAGYAPPAYAPPPVQNQYAPQSAGAAPYALPVQPAAGAPGNPHTAPARKGNPWKAIAVVMVIVAVGAGGWTAYQWNENRTNDEPAATTPAAQTPQTTTTTATPKKNTPMVEALPTTAEDEQNMNSVRSLMSAEDRQDFDGIMSHFSPNMERYWDISYPTRDQLSNRYADSWSKLSDPQNILNSIRKVASNTYDVSNTFRYYSVKDQKTKTVKGTNRFVFNDEGLIVQVWGLK